MSCKYGARGGIKTLACEVAPNPLKIKTDHKLNLYKTIKSKNYHYLLTVRDCRVGFGFRVKIRKGLGVDWNWISWVGD